MIVQPLRQKTSFPSVYHHIVLRCDMLQLNPNQGGIISRRSVDSGDSLHTYLHHFVKSARNMEPVYFRRYSVPLYLFMEYLTKLLTSLSLYRRVKE
jgi:hypothetical protein